MGEYRIFTDATADISVDMMAQMPETRVIPMNVEIGGREYIYGPEGTIIVKEFYRLQREGSFATTSQITPPTYFKFFEPCLREGKDILYLCFSSGMSGTYQSALLAAEELQKKYPKRKISSGRNQHYGDWPDYRSAYRPRNAGCDLLGQ